MSSSKHQVDLGSLQVSELDAISEAIEKDSVAFIDEIKIPRKTKKRVTMTLVAIVSLLILLITNFTVDTYQTYLNIAQSSVMAANLLVSVYLLTIFAILFYFAASFRHYLTLKDAFEVQSLTASSDEYGGQREVALKILRHYQSHHDPEIKEKAIFLSKQVETNSIHNPFLQIKTDIIDELDKQATKHIYQSAKEVSLFTAFSPGSAMDSIAVIFTSAKLMKNVFHIYGYRTNFVTSMLITRKILENASLAALVEYADDSINDILGNTLVSKISTKIAQGIGNGVLMLRIGNVLIQSARPFAPDGSIGTYKHMATLFLKYIKERVSKS